jgi:excisionase family DNA binding protein
MPPKKALKKMIYTPREAAEVSGLHYHTILSYIKAGHIEVLQLPSGYYRIPADKLQLFLESLKVKKNKKGALPPRE